MRTSLPIIALAAAAMIAGCVTSPRGGNGRRTGFMTFEDFSQFTRTPGAASNEEVLTSPEIRPPLDWNELIVSWNTKPGAWLKVEARGIYPRHATKYYTLGQWSNDGGHPRQSVAGQRDIDGDVKTDTLVLSHPCATVQLRLTLGGTNDPAPNLKFIGLSFCDSRAKSAAAETNRAAWGRELNIPERRQGDYAGGDGWCSPASLAMLLGYWSDVLHRPELNRPVPEVAAAINDPVFGGTGNWPFNTAYAGGFPSLRACVTRFNDLSEVEDWIAAGVPVILSVSSYLTNDRTIGPDNGHLIVCIGFTDEGDVVANDPGVSVRKNQRARRVYARDKVVKAWMKSKNAVYLIYPETANFPANRLGDWEAR